MTQSETTERAVFEAWIRKNGGDLSTFGGSPNVHYRNSAVNSAWTGWRARSIRLIFEVEPTDAHLLAAYGDAPFDSDFHRGLFLRHARIALAALPQAQRANATVAALARLLTWYRDEHGCCPLDNVMEQELPAGDHALVRAALAAVPPSGGSHATS